jgi:hypothetical protein
MAALLPTVWLGLARAAEDPSVALRIFPEKERMDMLKAYHARMNTPRHLQVADAAAWDAEKAALRKRILDGYGLAPLPADVPLDLTYGDKLERDDCTITRVRWQTFPGLYATGFLYMPKQATFPAPAVLHPHGHWANWSADDIVQARCLGLARRGYVSLAVQYEHFQDLNLGVLERGVFLYNNMRGVSVLQSLPEVDKERIGVTGASGGGQQSMDLAAVDERVKCAAIGVYPTYYQRILYIHAMGCFCNYGPCGALTYTDNDQYVAMIAPRPAVVFSVTGDWTAPSIDDEMKEVAGVYGLYPDPAGPEVANIGEGDHRILTSKTGRFMVERWPGPHDYTKAMRERMYWWMDWWLQGKHVPQPEPEGDLKLEPVSALTSLRVTTPKGHQWTDRNLAAIMRPGRVYPAPELKTKEDVTSYQQTLRTRLSALLGETGRTYGGKPASESLGTEKVGDWTVERLWYESEPGVKIPAWYLSALNAAAGPPVTILLCPNGKADVLVEPYRAACEEEIRHGRSVLAIDWRLRGEWAYQMTPPGKAPDITWVGNSLVWGRPELGMAVCDVRSAVDYLAGRNLLGKLWLRGMGEGAGFAALVAAALEPRIEWTHADLNYTDFASSEGAREPLLPRMLRYGDVGEIAALVAPNGLSLHNANPRTSLVTAEKTYALLPGAGARFSAKPEEPGALSEVRIANGGFEEGARGWTAEGGEVTVETGAADLGQAYLQVLPGQTVQGEPVPVKPGHEYALYVRICKSQPPQLDVFLQRGEQQYRLSSDTTDRMSWEGCSYDFLARPGETSVRIGFRVADAKATGEAGVDSVRLVEGNKIEGPKPDGKELLSVSSFAGLPLGAFEPSRKWEVGKWCSGYSPGATWEIVAGNEGRPALHVVSGPGGAYAALSALPTEPLQKGGLYRVSVTARGKAHGSINFWAIPNYLTPVVQFELSDDWKTYALDLFVETDLQARATPTLGITGEAWVDRMEMKVVE